MKVFGPAFLVVAAGSAAATTASFVVPTSPLAPCRERASALGTASPTRSRRFASPSAAALSARKRKDQNDDKDDDDDDGDKAAPSAPTSTNKSTKKGLDRQRQPAPGMDPAKRAALDGVLAQIERNYGRGSVVRLGDDPTSLSIGTIPSGALPLDAVLGGGGYPRGRIVEIYGPESSGKTTLALHAAAEAQRVGGVAAFVDAEHALDPTYAAALGVDVESLLVSQPDSGEMALDVVDRLVRSAAVDVVVVDSVAALVPRAELEGDMSDQQIGLQARLMSKAMRKIVGSLAMSQCTVIFLNQLRQKVGVIYGSPEVTPGGNALKFYSTIRLDTRRRDVLPDNSGIRIRVRAVKNKIAPPFRECHLDVLFGTGIDRAGSLLDAAVDCDVVVRRGSWYSYGESNFAQGRHNAAEKIREDEDLADRIEAEVRDAMRRGKSGESLMPSNGGEGGAGESDIYDEGMGSVAGVGRKDMAGFDGTME